MSPLVRQIVRSLRSEAERWQREGRFIRRDDGVVVQFIVGYDNRTTSPRLCQPREVHFTGVEAISLRRAIRAWLHRPI